MINIFMEMILPTTQQSKRALRTAVAIVSCTFIAFVFHFEMPFWATTSTMMIMERYVGNTLSKGILRIIGTLAGASLGYILAGLSTGSFMIFSLSCFFIMAIACYFSLVSRYPYAFIMGGIAAFLVIGNSIYSPSTTFQVAIWRTIEISTGVFVAMCCILLIAPTDSLKILSNNVNQKMQTLSLLFTRIISLYLNPPNSHFNLSQEIESTLKQLNSNLDLCNATLKEYMHNPLVIARIKQIIKWQIKFVEQLKLLLYNFSLNQNYAFAQAFLPEIESLINTICAIFSNLTTEQDDITALNLKLTELNTHFSKIHHDYKEKKANLHLYTYSIEEVMAFNQLIVNLNLVLEVLSEISFLLPSQQIKKDEFAANKNFPPLFNYQQTSTTLQHSIKGGISCIIALFLWLLTNWPGGLQGLVSAVFLSSEKNIYDTHLASELRLVGCALGGVTGLLCLFFFQFSLISLLITLFLFGWLFCYFQYADTKYSNLARQANFAFIISLIVGNMPATSINPSLERLSGIALGIIAILISAWFIWPVHPKAILNQANEKIYHLLSNLFQQIFLNNNLDSKKRAQFRASLTSYFHQLTTYLSSVETYSTDSAPFLLHKNEILYCQKQLTTLLFALADSCEIGEVKKLTAIVSIHFDEFLTEIKEILENLSHPDAQNNLKIIQLHNTIIEEVRQLRTLPLPLPYPQQAMSNMLACLNGLIKLLECCKNLNTICLNETKVEG